MNICMIGAGYVGLVSAACFSEFGWKVACIDKDATRVESLNAYIALDLGPSDVPLAFFVCEKCGQAEELSANDAVVDLISTADQKGFGVSHASLEVRGDCRGKLGCEPWDASAARKASSGAVDQHSHE